MKRTPILAFLAIAAAASAQHAHKIAMVFTDTDAAYVLQAISKQTGESILYNNKAKINVTLNLSVDTADEAISAVSSAAGLVSRRVGSLYVIAPAGSMKDALAPYATNSLFSVDPVFSEALAAKLASQYPYATITGIVDKISVTATKQDMLDIEDNIKAFISHQRVNRVVPDIYAMQRVNAEDVAPLLKTLYPGLEVTPSGGGKSTGGTTKSDETAPRLVQQSFGFIALRGPEQLVKDARATLEKLDLPIIPDGPNRVVNTTYELRYVNGISVSTMLKKAFPEMDVFVGPEEYSPPRPVFNSLSGSIGGSLSGGTGGSSSSTGGSTSGSGSSGGGSNSGGGNSGSGGGSGSTGGASGGAAGGGGGGGNRLGDRAKFIVLRGRQVDVDSAMKLLAEVDVKPKQVVIEVKVIETSPTEAQNLGINYNFSPINFYDVGPGAAIAGLASAVANTGGVTEKLGGSGLSRSPFNFQSTLNALVSKQTAKLLATPSLWVKDNDQASFFIGNTISVELSSVSGLGATSQSIAQFPVGIILLISPRISPDGTVTLHVNPVVSTVSSINAQGIPQTAAREAETTMILKDGETVVLGGLIQDQDSRTISAVPILSKIPILGELFKNRNTTHSKEDIVISITPHIVKDK